MKKLQIGVMGSASENSTDMQEIAKQVGSEIGKSKNTLLFGIEPDSTSLPMIAALAAKRKGGVTIGISPSSKKLRKNLATHEIVSGSDRGGGREFVLVNSCDAIITIGGGSGTLTEIAIAYQAGIPIVGLSVSKGWTDKLTGTYLDQRKRLKIQKSKTAKEAVQKVIYSINNMENQI